MKNTNKVGFWSQVALTFFIVSGGAYGLEASVGAIGAFWTMILIVLIPIFWAAPTALLVAELASAIPENGGYYIWVRRGLGKFWAFQEGWWTLNYSAVDLAIYPVLFVTYLSFFFPQLNSEDPHMSLIRWGICIAFIFSGLLMNLLGSRALGLQSLAKFVLVSLPFLILIIMGLFLGSWHNLAMAFHPSMQNISSAQIASGLAILLWNFCGWDNVSTYADEVYEPQKTFPKALLTAMLIIVASYLFPILIGYKASIDPKVWGESSGWPEIATRLVGPWLGISIAIAALISAWALFNAQLLYISRLPSAMAEDGLLPVFFTKKTKNGVPFVSLIMAGTIAALFSRWSLGKLMVVDILFYTLGLSLEFFALIALRSKEPNLKRPFKIPLGKWGLILITLPPLTLGLVVAITAYDGDSAKTQLGVVAGSIILGFVIYFWKKRFGSLRGPKKLT